MSITQLSDFQSGSRVLVIDNYDSFVYNLVQYLGELEAEVMVVRNDELEKNNFVKQINEDIKPTHILLSPGPGRPEAAGLTMNIIREFAGKLPILGVCLGMQAIGEVYGAKLIHAPTLMHGKTSEIHVVGKHSLFKDIPSPYTATRYHSLILERQSVISSQSLILEAETEDHVVMAISHKDHPNLVGVQYHPESILSEYGHKLLSNFLNLQTSCLA